MKETLRPSIVNFKHISDSKDFHEVIFSGISFTAPDLKKVQDKYFLECTFVECVFDCAVFSNNTLRDCQIVSCLVYKENPDDDNYNDFLTLSSAIIPFRQKNKIKNTMMEGVLVSTRSKKDAK